MNEDNEPILIGEAGDIEPNSVEHFEYEETDYAIYNLESGFYSTQGTCTCEDHALLSEGTIDNEEIECPSCGKTFNIITGDAISDPEATSLKIYDITLENKKLFLNLN